MKKIWNQLGHSLFAEDESSRKTKHILKTVFFFYILVLLKVIVFKYPLARLEAIAASWTKEVVWEGLGTANFTLFKTIRMYICYWGKLNSFENLFGNVLAFVPLGFLLPFLQKESRRFWILFLDDILLNCVGALLGYAVFSRCLRDARRTQEKQDAPGAPGTVG